MYLSSESILVFPTTKRPSYLEKSGLVTELAVANLVRNLTDTEGNFVIPQETGIIFYILGYCFNLNSSAITTLQTNLSTDIYATIELSNENNFIELIGQDDDGEYTGVDFTATELTGENKYCLHLYSKVDTNWNIPPESIVRISAEKIGPIDGGIIS